MAATFKCCQSKGIKMFEKITTISPSVCQDVRKHLDRNVYKYLGQDVSSYARGRKRVWLQTEYPLSMRHQEFQPGIDDERLWSWIQKLWYKAGYEEPPESALAIHGGVPISFHPDAPAAAPESLQINLGGTEFVIDESPKYERKGKIYVPESPVSHILDTGEVSKFNCKHVHSTINPNKDRWSIIVWRISSQARYRYNQYLRYKNGELD